MPVFEIMHVNHAIRSMIRESKVHQIDAAIAISGAEGMISMDNSLLELVRQGKITMETASAYALIPETLEKRLAFLKQGKLV